MKRLIVSAAAIVLVAFGAALAFQAQQNVIHGCYQNENGQLRVVSDPGACRPSESPIAWNQQGPAGPPGGDTRPARYTKFCNEVLDPDGTPVDVMTLDVPAGAWIATVSIQTGPLGSCGAEDPQAGLSHDGDFDCTLAGGVGGGGHPASSRAGEFRTVAWSEAVYSEGWTRVAVRCRHFGGPGSSGATLSVGDLTLVPVPGVLVSHMP